MNLYVDRRWKKETYTISRLLIDGEVFAKGQEIRNSKVRSQNIIRACKPQKQLPKIFCFTAVNVERKYDAPYLQTQYAYNQIGEISDERKRDTYSDQETSWEQGIKRGH